MGVSTDAIICFGILLDEDSEYPFQDKDIEDWWIYDVLQFKHSINIYDENGNYKDGYKPPEEVISAYHRESIDFGKQNPPPVELVTHCSHDYPMYVLAIPGTVKKANRGYPVVLNPQELVVTNEQTKSLIDFCNEYNIEMKDKPNWYLVSMWD